MSKLWGWLIILISMLFSYETAGSGDALSVRYVFPTVEDISKTIHFGHYRETKREPDVVVIHSTYNAAGRDSFSMEGVLRQFRRYNVCAHYIIDRSGKIYKAVAESDVAYHAGRSHIPGTSRYNINSSSIGIEIINSPLSPPTELQYNSLLFLVQDLRRRYPIEYVLRHSDIAPHLKSDPWAFDWQRFKAKLSVADIPKNRAVER